MDENRAMDQELRRALVEGCALDGTELDERLRKIERLTQSALVDRKDTADRIALSFDLAAAAEVRDLVQRERECCGHLEFAVEETDKVIQVEIGSHPSSASTCGCPMCGA